MAERWNLTEAEIKSLIFARYNAESAKAERLKARCLKECGYEAELDTPEILAFKMRVNDFASGLIARRLKRGERTAPLISFQDIEPFISSFIDAIAQEKGYKLDSDDRQMLEDLLREASERISTMAQCEVSSQGGSAYDENWRWINIVLDLAAERGRPATELLALEAATDEITRRMYSKEQFIARASRGVSNLPDIDTIMSDFFQPMIDQDAGGDKILAREMKEEFESEYMSKLREDIEKFKVIFETWLNEEVARIYHAA